MTREPGRRARPSATRGLAALIRLVRGFIRRKLRDARAARELAGYSERLRRDIGLPSGRDAVPSRDEVRRRAGVTPFQID